MGDVMDCKQAENLIVDYLYDGLSQKEQEAFEHHLQSCPEHAREVEKLRGVLQIVRKDRIEDPPEELSRRILAAAGAEVEKKTAPKAPLWVRFAFGPVAAAAVLLVITVVGISLFEKGKKETSAPQESVTASPQPAPQPAPKPAPQPAPKPASDGLLKTEPAEAAPEGTQNAQPQQPALEPTTTATPTPAIPSKSGGLGFRAEKPASKKIAKGKDDYKEMATGPKDFPAKSSELLENKPQVAATAPAKPAPKSPAHEDADERFSRPPPGEPAKEMRPTGEKRKTEAEQQAMGAAAAASAPAVAAEEKTADRADKKISTCDRERAGAEKAEKDHPNEPKTADALFTLAECYEQIGKHDKALELYRQIDREFPSRKEEAKRAILRIENPE
jgi:hypothetical protein